MSERVRTRRVFEQACDRDPRLHRTRFGRDPFEARGDRGIVCVCVCEFKTNKEIKKNIFFKTIQG